MFDFTILSLFLFLVLIPPALGLIFKKNKYDKQREIVSETRSQLNEIKENHDCLTECRCKNKLDSLLEKQIQKLTKAKQDHKIFV